MHIEIGMLPGPSRRNALPVLDGKGTWRDNVFVERRAIVRHWSEDNGRAAEHHTGIVAQLQPEA